MHRESNGQFASKALTKQGTAFALFTILAVFVASGLMEDPKPGFHESTHTLNVQEALPGLRVTSADADDNGLSGTVTVEQTSLTPVSFEGHMYDKSLSIN